MRSCNRAYVDAVRLALPFLNALDFDPAVLPSDIEVHLLPHELNDVEKAVAVHVEHCDQA